MDKLTEESDHLGRPSPDDFDAFIPWACTQLQIDGIVEIIKVMQDEYVSVAASDRSKSHKGKAKLQIKEKILTPDEDTSDPEKEYRKEASYEDIDLDKFIKIYTIYDSTDSLVQIKFDKNKNIPRKLLTLIRLIIEFHIHLTNITINRGLDQYGLYELSKILPKSNITDLCLDNTTLPNANYEILLEHQNFLIQLSLCRCKIDDNVVKNIAAKIVYTWPASKSLSILNLSSNRITDMGAKYLGDALRTNRHLSYLNLADNMITDEGASALMDILLEFPLTGDELKASRARHLIYLREKNDIVSQMIVELKMGDFDKKLLRKKTVRPVSAVKKGKILEKEPSSKSIPDNILTNMDAILYEKAEDMAENVMGEFKDPFSSNNIISRDGVVFSHGNNTLAYISLAYNSLSFFTVKKLLQVVKGQKELNRKPKGLINVSIEGNCLPGNCPELIQLNDLLDAGLLGLTRRQSIIKKKSALKSGR